MRTIITAAAVAAAMAAAPVCAQEAWVGVLAHAVHTPITLGKPEGGTDIQLGYRFARQDALGAIGRPAPYAFVSINTIGDTSLAAAGLSWTLGKGPIFVRPGIGVAIHDGPKYRVTDGMQTQLGSRVLFEPELGIGTHLGQRWTIEAQWTHISHGRLAGRQNPGLDMIGARLTHRFGGRP